MRRLPPGRTLLLAALLSVPLAGCGGGDDDDDDDDTDVDAASVDATTPTADAGGQAIGQFCNTLPGGGPFCAPDLSCCDDTLTCRLPEDCSDGTGYLPCTDGGDCPSSKICCDTSAMRFCTKPSACSAYGGTEIP